MSHARQGADGGLQQVVAGLALGVRHQAKATVVPELVGVVETSAHVSSLQMIHRVAEDWTSASPSLVAAFKQNGRPFYTTPQIVATLLP
jgi:hypothetical protein